MDEVTSEVQADDRQDELTIRLEEALPSSALGLLENAEARYAAAIDATAAPVVVATTAAT